MCVFTCVHVCGCLDWYGLHQLILIHLSVVSTKVSHNACILKVKVFHPDLKSDMKELKEHIFFPLFPFCFS